MEQSIKIGKSKTKKAMALFMLIIIFLFPISNAYSLSDNEGNENDFSLEVNLPKYSSRDNLRFNGTTIENAMIDVYVNGDAMRSDLSDENGTFSFKRILLDEGIENKIEIFAEKLEGDENAYFKGYVEVDNEKPEFKSFSGIPEKSRDPQIELEGELSEKCRIELKKLHKGDFAEQSKEILEENATSFKKTISLEEGETEIIITAYDKAENKVEKSSHIYVDTTPPVIQENNLRDLSPTYSRSFTVKGKISEESKVRIEINSDENKNYQCSDGKDNDNDGYIDYPNDPGCESPEDIVENNVDYNYECSDNKDNDEDGRIDFPDDLGCDSAKDDNEINYNGTSACSDNKDNDGDGRIDYNPAGGGDWGCSSLEDDDESDDPEIGNIYTTTTDEDGNFEKKVTISPSLSSSFSGLSSNSISADSGERTSLNFESATEENDVKIVAIDKVGLSSETTGTVNYATCNAGDSDFLAYQEEVFPASIIPDHLFMGIAQISFSLKLEYVGANNLEDVNVLLTKRRVSNEDSKDWDTNVFNPSNCHISSTSSKQDWYVNCNLDRYPPEAYRNMTSAYERLEEQGDLKLPINVRIDYSESYEQNGKKKTVSKSQRICYDMIYPLDIRLDPDDIPRDLLNKSVEVIDKTLDTINRVIPLVTKAKWITAAGCFGMYVWNYISNFGEYAACGMKGLNKEQTNMIEKVIYGDSNLNPDEMTIKNALEEAGFDGDEDISDCVNVKKKFIESKTRRQFLCDRIFCPAVPSAQKYRRDQKEKDEASSISPCSLESYKSEESQLSYINNDPKNKEQMSWCENDYENNWQSACLAQDSLEQSRDLRKEAEGDDAATGLSNFMNKMNDLSLCKAGKNSGDETGTAYSQGDGNYILREKEDGKTSYYIGKNREEGTYDQDSGQATDKQNFYKKTTFDSYNKKDNGGKTSINADELYSETPSLTKGENGCLVAKPDIGFQKDSDSTKYRDVKKGDETESILLQDVSDKNVDLNNLYGKSKANYYVDENGIVYYKETDEIKKAPQMYVKQNEDKFEGVLSENPQKIRDECYKSDDVERYEVKEILINPAGSFINSLQCVCIPGIEGYLMSIKNVLTAIKNCFESILVTGEFGAGACKAVLSQYLCDFVYDFLGCYINDMGSIKTDGSGDGERKDEPLKQMFVDMKNAGEKISKSSSERYGSTSTFKALFNERRVVRSVCLAAFGYDWQPDLESAMSMSGGGVVLNSTGSIPVATRRFHSYDPTNEGTVSFVYHVGYFLSAGAPLTWGLELICSSTNECSESEGFKNGKCDCFNNYQTPNSAVTQNPYVNPSVTSNSGNTPSGVGFTRRIDGGVLEGGDYVGASSNPYSQSLGSSGTGDIYITIDDPVRYNKVRLWWKTKGPTKTDDRNGEVTIPIKQIGGKAPGGCTFSAALGRYHCDFFQPENGYVKLSDVNMMKNGQVSDSEPEEIAFEHDEEIRYEVKYFYQPPKEGNEGKNIYLKTKFIDSDDVILGEYNEDNIENAQGRIVVPLQDVTPNSLVGDEKEYYESKSDYSSSISQGKIDATYKGNEKPPEINNLDSEVIGKTLRIEKPFEETRKYIVVYYNGTNENLKYVEFDWPRTEGNEESNYPTPEAALLSALDKKTDNKFQDLIVSPELIQYTKGEDKDYLLGRIKGSDIQFDISKCNDGICASYFVLAKAKNDAVTIERRCETNGNNPLEWNAELSFVLESNGKPSSIPAPTNTAKGGTVSKKVPLKIDCNPSGTTQEKIAKDCPYDVKLTKDDYGCYCNDDLFNENDNNKYCARESNDKSLETKRYSLRNNLTKCPEIVYDEQVPKGFKSLNLNGKCSVEENPPKTCSVGEYYHKDDDKCKNGN
ncbi:MAG: hypothetical protein ACQER9_03750 [Nanobdellota archaeon]